MIIIIMRHGEAEEAGHGVPGEDEKRKLTEKGLRQSRRVAQAMEALRYRPDVILTSPLVRAIETAHAAVKEIKKAPAPIITQTLAPGHQWKDVLRTARRHASPDSTVLLVGHQPDLGQYILAALRQPIDRKNEFPLTKSAFIALNCETIKGQTETSVHLALDPESAKVLLKRVKRNGK